MSDQSMGEQNDVNQRSSRGGTLAMTSGRDIYTSTRSLELAHDAGHAAIQESPPMRNIALFFYENVGKRRRGKQSTVSSSSVTRAARNKGS